MKLLFVSFLALSSLVSATPIYKRDAATVKADIAKIDADITAVKTAVSDFDGNLIKAIAVLSASNTLKADVQKATTDTNASAAFTVAESKDITAAILALRPKQEDSLATTVAKKETFEKAGLKSSVRDSLVGLRDASKALNAAFVAKLAEGDKATVLDSGEKTQAAFANAIAVYT